MVKYWQYRVVFCLRVSEVGNLFISPLKYIDLFFELSGDYRNMFLYNDYVLTETQRIFSVQQTIREYSRL
jgi:hypothetical protein